MDIYDLYDDLGNPVGERATQHALAEKSQYLSGSCLYSK